MCQANTSRPLPSVPRYRRGGGQAGLPLEGEALPDNLGSLPPESVSLPPESEELSRGLLVAGLPEWLASRLETIGQRSRDKRKVREVLRALCAERPYRAAELAMLLRRNQEYLQKEYITPMRQEGELVYRYQDDPNRPDQAYVTPDNSRS